MSYTEELLEKANEVIPRVTLEDFNNDQNSKLMIDVRQHEELVASGSIKGSIHIPKGVIEFKLNNNDEVSFDTSIYVFCAVGVRSAIAGYNLKNTNNTTITLQRDEYKCNVCNKILKKTSKYNHLKSKKHINNLNLFIQSRNNNIVD